MSTNKEPSKAVVKNNEDRLDGLLQKPSIQERFDKILGERSGAFMSSIISVVNSNKYLKECEPMSVISAAAVAASMDLQINPSLGLAFIVPYAGQAQFQIGWKGYYQLAMRSGQYKTINVTPVLEGQIKSKNQFTGQMKFNNKAKSDKKVGYLLYFKLLSGFEKWFYMTTEECHAHGKKYSKMFQKNQGWWVDDFDTMAMKTVIRLGLSKFGPLSVEMAKAIEYDQASLDDEGKASFPDNPENENEVNETKEASTKPEKLAKIINDQKGSS